MDDLPPIPDSFRREEDADSVTLVLRSTRPATWGDRLRGLRAKERRDLGWSLFMAVGFVVLLGWSAYQRQAGPVWGLFAEGLWPTEVGSVFALGMAFVVGSILAGMVALRLAAAGSFLRGIDAVERTTTWRIERTGLKVADEALVPWHAIRAVALEGEGIRVDLHEGDGLVEPVSWHLRQDRVALVDRLRAHVTRASVSEADRRAAHAAVGELSDRKG